MHAEHIKDQWFEHLLFNSVAIDVLKCGDNLLQVI